MPQLPEFQGSEARLILKRVLGDEHGDTLASMGNLAVGYLNQGRYSEAEPLFVKALEIMKRVHGEEHPNTLRTMTNLAIVYKQQGRNAEAEPLILKTLEMKKRVLGQEHPETLGSITNLGNLYNATGRYDAAREMYETSLPIKRRVLAKGHPFTRNAIIGLAEAYVGLGRREDALPLYRELFELQLAPADEPNADARTLNNAAWTLLTHDFEELRDPERALRLAERACSIEEAASGANLWMFLDTLALAQHHTGDTAAAVETQKRAVYLIPDGANEATITEVKTNLHTYEAALAAPSGDDSEANDGGVK